MRQHTETTFPPQFCSYISRPIDLLHREYAQISRGAFYASRRHNPTPGSLIGEHHQLVHLEPTTTSESTGEYCIDSPSLRNSAALNRPIDLLHY